MPRFRLEHADGTSTYEQAARVDVDEQAGTLTLMRAHLGVWTAFRELPAQTVTRVSRRHTEVNGTWTWSTLWTNPDPQPTPQDLQPDG